ncbi:hypothetical protein HY024_04895 [Candidatus Curtissbacteria bacterium]|nr:hypothetical protein [Candidatus Curtissbacteria bacterium]
MSTVERTGANGQNPISDLEGLNLMRLVGAGRRPIIIPSAHGLFDRESGRPLTFLCYVPPEGFQTADGIGYIGMASDPQPMVFSKPDGEQIVVIEPLLLTADEGMTVLMNVFSVGNGFN